MVWTYKEVKSLPEKTSWSHEEMFGLVDKYLKRFDEELKEIEELHEKYNSKPKALKEETILKLKQAERDLFDNAGYGKNKI